MPAARSFNSHVERLALAIVALVNAVTVGHDGLEPVAAPKGSQLRRKVSEAVREPGYRGDCTTAEAERLVPWIALCRKVIEMFEAEQRVVAVDFVNAMLHDTGARTRLQPDEDGDFSIHFHGPDDSFDKGWAAGLASGLALAIGGGFAHRFGTCQAAPCDRVWVDFSKNAHRRFCSVRCQSRVKAAAHRARHR